MVEAECSDGCQIAGGGPSDAPEFLRVTRVVAYLCEPDPARGSGPLFKQKAAIDAAAFAKRLKVAAYVVDSWIPLPGEDYGPALIGLLDEAAVGRIGIVLVEHVCQMSKDYSAALLAAIAFRRCGTAVVEARGGTVAYDHAVAETALAVIGTKRRAIAIAMHP